MKKLLLFFCAFFPLIGCAQIPANRPHCQNAAFDKKVAGMLSFSIPVISCDEVKKNQENYLLLDAREKKEYEVSHIKGAKYIGYDKLDLSALNNVDKNKTIVVYCSIGYRSEKIGEKLKKMGYTNVYNLFGSIFEWVNTGNEVVNNENNPTKKIHTYNQKWSRWVDEKKAQKTW